MASASAQNFNNKAGATGMSQAHGQAASNNFLGMASATASAMPTSGNMINTGGPMANTVGGAGGGNATAASGFGNSLKPTQSRGGNGSHRPKSGVSRGNKSNKDADG